MTSPDTPTNSPNKLITETSPYLLQHAYNPVDWMPWGEEAFELARERGVPIFLSIGYSTCYWCHVMERESFEDAATAAVLNEQYVAVKVDREQRPDVDDLYMAAVQILTRGGGWPMSVWLTPPGARGEEDAGLKPFYAGTYFPPEPAYNRPSFTQVLEGITRAWREDRGQVLGQADQLALAVREHFNESVDAEGVRIDEREIGLSVETLLRIFDSANGGFGGAPKFPQPHYARFLLATVDEIEQDDAKDKAEHAIRHTLDKMACGGIHDHLGGGFHRYSVDEKWIVPHFEKMLYDNGLLLSAYADAFVRWRDPMDARVLGRTRAWIEREMTADLGGGTTGPFYAALDAEVDRREGLNYLWTQEEIDALIVADEIEQDDATFVSRVLGVQAGVNFQDPHHPDEPGRTVLCMPNRPDKLAAMLGIETDAFLQRLDEASDALLRVRDRRKQPHRDEKILASWNGLAIAGLADSAASIGDKRALELALCAADWVIEHMRGDHGLFARSAVIEEDGAVRVADAPLMLEDQANMVQGLLSLDRAARLLNQERPELRETAVSVVRKVMERFVEEQGSGIVYDVAPDQDLRFARTRATYDGATPSAVGSYLNVLVELFEITRDRSWLDHAVDVLRGVSGALKGSPISMLESVRALFRLLQHDGSLPDKLGSIEARGGSAAAEDSPVTILSAPGKVEAGADGSVRVPIRIEIDEGYHINAADVGEVGEAMGLMRLRADVRADDVVWEAALEMPVAEEYSGGAFSEDGGEKPVVNVYSGIVEGVLVLDGSRLGVEAEGGRPFVTVTYQACSDTACFEPMTVSLDIAFAPGEVEG